MAGFNSTIEAGIQPFDNSSSNLAQMSYNWRANYVKSAHTQMRYQVIWRGLNENQEPLASNFTGLPSSTTVGNGDVINVIFRIYASTQFPYPASSSEWDLVGTIRKSRDIANISYSNGLANLSYQRFTIDISQLSQDLLSYSLVPINKGTWQSSEWGGMNGGETKQDNVTAAISAYNVTPNGTYRHIWVTATPEVLLGDGTVEEARGAGVSLSFNKIAVINSVAQFEKDTIYYNLKYIIQKSLANTNNPRGFMSLCPNFTQTTNTPFLKQVREDEEAEWLYWWQRNMGIPEDVSAGIANQQTTKARLKVETYLSNGTLQNTMYLSDFNSNLDKETVSYLEVFKLNQNRVCVQNVSPTYINANAQDNGGLALTNQIDSNTSYYKTHLEYINAENNLISNGDFANGSTGWSTTGVIVISGGVATFTISSGAYAKLSPSVQPTYVSGTVYKLMATVNGTAGKEIRFRDDTGNVGGLTSSNGKVLMTGSEQKVEFTWTANANSDVLAIERHTGSGSYDFTVTNISLQANPTTIRATEYRCFSIDRESVKIPYGFVRFHWLNRLGGIDSYTAKRDVMESLSISRDTIETKSADRTWYQDNQYASSSSVLDSDYISNTMRGGNLYKGGREVLNVNAQKNNSVYTEPLNKQTADWLVEIMTSPNVWIEMDTDATARGNTVNPYQRPSTKEYIPVIITNSDVETVNQEAGLVRFNIEYTLSHKVQTQRN
jgi:hypothetical protein